MPAALDGYGQDWLNKINGLRTSKGLNPLQLDGELTGLAQGWSEHMAATGVLSHTPNMAANVSSDWTKLGENVGYGPNNDLIWNGFLNSPKHYENLVDPAYTHVGIGVAFVGGTEFVTHRFMAAGGGGGGGGGGGDTYEAPSNPAPTRRSSPPATSPARARTRTGPRRAGSGSPAPCSGHGSGSCRPRRAARGGYLNPRRCCARCRDGDWLR